jgi:hypothetical protein
MVLLRSLDEEEFLLVNAHKLKPYLVQEEQHSEEPTTQEDTRAGDCQVNQTVTPIFIQKSKKKSINPFKRKNPSK